MKYYMIPQLYRKLISIYKKASFIFLIFFASLGLLIKLLSPATSWRTMALFIAPFVFPLGMLSVLYARYDAVARRTISFGENGFCLWNKKLCVREVPYHTITDVTAEDICGFFIGTQKENFHAKYICIYLNHAKKPPLVSYAKLFKQKNFFMIAYSEDVLRELQKAGNQFHSGGIYEILSTIQ